MKKYKSFSLKNSEFVQLGMLLFPSPLHQLYMKMGRGTNTNDVIGGTKEY